ncbi:Pterin binding enzyme [Planctomycetes bacterium Pan216]|uniref:Pterin binding enzyme n=1 Tax=Kolteria novifilia TaxID=2527975 RepID=A0A518BD62_9BACT|nr:Pterin binding enzyme [Planctomycetes bacterium Pan216]
MNRHDSSISESRWSGQTIGFVTGRLAEPALRRLVGRLSEKLRFTPKVLTTKISVAALMTTDWLTRQLQVPAETSLVLLPGLCKGSIETLQQRWPETTFDRGPEDFRNLPEYFQLPPEEEPYGDYDIEILAEINHADRLARDELIAAAERARGAGADFIDLGCTPGSVWSEVGTAVEELVARGLRVSIDTFNAEEVASAVASGASLVLSVNASNLERAADWGTEVVLLPDNHNELDWLDQLRRSVERLEKLGVAYRIDPIVEPIGFGFAPSLERYLQTRAAFPDAEIMMGIGNVTELTEVDSAGVNAVLIGFCQELGIRSVLTTEVINWARGAVAEVDVARRLMKYAIDHRRLPKHRDSRLVQLRDPRILRQTIDDLEQLQQRIKDRNVRIFTTDDKIAVVNSDLLVESDDPFELFERLGIDDASHAFYLGWEMMKAATALQLGKNYTQDRSLRWGLLTEEEASYLEKKRQRERPPTEGTE